MTSIYFFHPSWYSNIPDLDGVGPQTETVVHIAIHSEGTPTSFYNAGHGLFFKYCAVIYNRVKKYLPFNKENGIYITAKLITAFVALLSVLLFHDITQSDYLSLLFVVNPIFASYCQVPLYHFHVMFFCLLTFWSYKDDCKFTID